MHIVYTDNGRRQSVINLLKTEQNAHRIVTLLWNNTPLCRGVPALGSAPTIRLIIDHFIGQCPRDLGVSSCSGGGERRGR